MPEEIKLTAVVDRIEENQAVLKFLGGQTVNWPSEFLPKDVKEGSVIHLLIGSEPQTQEAREALAKALLNEIFKKQN